MPLHGDTSQDLFEFLKTLERNVNRFTPATALSGASKQSLFSVERKPPAFDYSSATVANLASALTPSKLQSLASAVLILSLFAEPIYVGMTAAEQGLRGRLKQHLQSVDSFDAGADWSGAFRTRMASVLRDSTLLSRCVVAYMPMSAFDLGEHAARLLEQVLIRIVRPAQNIRT